MAKKQTRKKPSKPRRTRNGGYSEEGWKRVRRPAGHLALHTPPQTHLRGVHEWNPQDHRWVSHEIEIPPGPDWSEDE